MTRRRPTTAALLTLVAALCVLLAAPLAAVSADADGPDARAGSSWGSATAKRQELRKGCRDYAFRYRIDVPGDAWMAEITLKNPAGRSLATVTYESDRQPDVGTRHFRFCDVSTRPGPHRIYLKVTSYDERDQAVRRSAPTTFRIVRR